MIYNILILFASTFTLVCFLGIQGQFVRLGHKMMSFMTSTGIGILQIFSYKILPTAGTLELIAFVLGGAIGIVASIELHDLYVKQMGIKDNRGIEK